MGVLVVILTVTLNPALDLTYAVGALEPGRAHRVSAVVERAGGKGLNVARVLHRLGEKTIATGLLGGRNGSRVAELLDVPARFTPIEGETRRTVVVMDGEATGFWEPGPSVTPDEWASFVDVYTGLVSVARVAVLSGSLPAGLPEDAYAVLVSIARAAGIKVVLDTSGPALEAALGVRPDLVKPNAEELAALVPGADLSTVDGVVAAASELRERGAAAVLASRGPEGLVAVTGDGAYAAVPAAPVAGNPTGAGDACVAAVARSWTYRQTWPNTLVEAVAASAAAVAAPQAGDLDVTEYRRQRHGVTVTEI